MGLWHVMVNVIVTTSKCFNNLGIKHSDFYTGSAGCKNMK